MSEAQVEAQPNLDHHLDHLDHLIQSDQTYGNIPLGNDRSEATKLRHQMGERDYVYHTEMEVYGFEFYAKRRSPGDDSVSQPWLEHTDDSIICYEDLNPDQEQQTLTEVLQELPTGDRAALVTELYLGHDGIIFANKEMSTDPELIISLFDKIIKRLPNLVQIDYCGYYSDFTEEHINEAAKRNGRTVWAVEVT